MVRIALITVIVCTLAYCSPVRAAPPAQADTIAAHLGFFGYETETTDEFLRANHPSNLNIAIKEHRGGVLFLSFLGASAYGKENPNELTALANELNVNATVSRSYVDKDGDLALEAWFPGTYEKARFSLFLEEWNKDTILQLRQHTEEVDKLFD